MNFKGKIILIISPQSWGMMQISKQHYANELVSAGAHVFFINPPLPQLSLRPNFTKKQLNNHLTIIDYTVPFIAMLKYRLFSLFSIVNRYCIEYFFKKENIEINIVWNFDNGLVSDRLLYRKAQINIYHPVDQLRIPVIMKPYHFVFSLSNEILSTIDHSVKYFINHGLGKEFEQYTTENINDMRSVAKTNHKKTCAYVGNLLAKAIDRKNFIGIIKGNPDIDFLLIGTYEAKNSNLLKVKELDKETIAFIEGLKKLTNAYLLGPMSHQEIIQKFDDIDCFFICYKMTSFYKCDNSHKVLEYLSSGKPVISSYISTYDGLELIEMVGIDDNQKLAKLITTTLDQLYKVSDTEKAEKRIKYALSNTYKQNLKKIEEIIF